MTAKLVAALWAIAVFVFAGIADICFKNGLIVLGLASSVATIASICYTIYCINEVLDC
jgi:hypothetical protein